MPDSKACPASPSPAPRGRRFYSNEVYAYDATGNRTSHTVGATAYAYTYPATSHRLTSFTGPAARSYTYDGPRPRGARGRMTNITTGSVNQYGINARPAIN